MNSNEELNCSKFEHKFSIMQLSYDIMVCEDTEGCGQSLTMVVPYA